MCINSYADNFKIIDEFLDMYMLNGKTNMNLSKNSSSDDKNDLITNGKVILGDEMLFTDEYKHLIDGSKNVKNAVRILNSKLIGNKIIFIIHLIYSPPPLLME